ncbi:hypothetical protein KC19_4G234700 [Ceratodon purpureus]|uniref:DUF7748 domain-containing protein n=1 Tax=Ceratodon purpureus TaxID=3225 RepID=A0A8T0IFF4_CERPU|nr:hypothetical protein KC19_4G234700 [Ceratodon purpureus]
MVKIKVRNDLDAPIDLKEGHPGNFREITTIEPGESYKIDFLPEATYREYKCVVSTDSSMIVNLSSDDLSESPEEIVITKNADGKLIFKLRKKNGFDLGNVTSDANIERGTAAVGKFFSKYVKGPVLSWLPGKSKDKKQAEAAAAEAHRKQAEDEAAEAHRKQAEDEAAEAHRKQAEDEAAEAHRKQAEDEAAEAHRKQAEDEAAEAHRKQAEDEAAEAHRKQAEDEAAEAHRKQAEDEAAEAHRKQAVQS